MTRYPYTLATYDSDQLHGEIVALALPGYLGVCGSGTTVEALFDAALTGPQKSTLDTAVAAHVPNPNAALLRLRAAAKVLAQAADIVPEALRAVLLTVLDEINVLRQRDRDRSTDVAASTSLADLKTRWAARSTLNDRTAAQAKQAVLDKIDTGNAD